MPKKEHVEQLQKITSFKVENLHMHSHVPKTNTNNTTDMQESG